MGVKRQRGIAVHAVFLQRHEVGPDIAFLKHMYPQPAQPRHLVSGGVIGAAIAVQDQIGNAVLHNEIVKEQRPVTERAAIVGRLARPIDLVAAVDVDPHRLMTAYAQRVGKHGEEGSMGALQKEEGLGEAVSHEDTRRTMS